MRLRRIQSQIRTVCQILALPEDLSGRLRASLGCCFPRSDRLATAQGGRELSTHTSDAYIQLRVAADRLVQSAVYCGTLRVSAHMLWSIAGLPTTYLSGIVEKCENRVISDILTFLHEDWAEVLYHDQFPTLRRELQNQIRQLSKEAEVVEESAIDATTKEAFAKFLKLHAPDLPAYRGIC